MWKKNQVKIKTTEEQDIAKLQSDLQIRRPLPTGRTQMIGLFERIKASIDFQIGDEDILFTLYGMILALGPTEAFKEDGYFMLGIRKLAANQVASMLMKELKDKKMEELKKQAEATAKPILKAVDGVLED